jgi:hypothetical protein
MSTRRLGPQHDRGRQWVVGHRPTKGDLTHGADRTAHHRVQKLMADVTLENVFEPLNDLDYPAAKEDVVRHAESRGASVDVLRALRALPLGDYASRDELARSVHTMESGF